MNFADDQAQIEDLPTTFRRPGAPFNQVMDSVSGELVRYTDAADVVDQQIALFTQARFGWLDVWGLLFGVARFANEADSAYLIRIAYTVTAGGGTPCGMARWIKATWRIDVTITEIFSESLGYTIEFDATVPDSLIVQVLISIARVRPAGVPFLVAKSGGLGLYLDTIDFLDAAKVTGSYFPSSLSNPALPIPASTNNAKPDLPDLYLTDTTLNPSLAR